MDLNDYVNQLGQLDKQEIEVELNNFYTFNSGLLQFFKAIDNQFQMLLNSTTLNPKSIESVLAQSTKILSDLNNFKFAVSMLDEDEISEYYRKDISKTLKYIKEVMVISEVEHIKQNFDKLLLDNENKFSQEQANKESLIKEKNENQKRIELEQQEKIRLEGEKRKLEEQEQERKENEIIERERLEKIKLDEIKKQQSEIDLLKKNEEKRKHEEAQMHYYNLGIELSNAINKSFSKEQWEEILSIGSNAIFDYINAACFEVLEIKNYDNFDLSPIEKFTYLKRLNIENITGNINGLLEYLSSNPNGYERGFYNPKIDSTFGFFKATDNNFYDALSPHFLAKSDKLEYLTIRHVRIGVGMDFSFTKLPNIKEISFVDCNDVYKMFDYYKRDINKNLGNNVIVNIY